ncbi:preprotein translocase subunit YajC [Teredinibacter turnerae]|uniref:Sec translocon accessory complex subunit YajC n=1 Tax=Teredinibacter turnerae (strain ATCC 39867 / T7901) TaxID=377629 RepID=C5BU73_TERTT|nr:preprotein translocase subunit YajC [Teredinibacter turnerae]ACR12332.1 preprotein translocase, YajC subunit [Teredinibacter turnerae T7901]
MGFFIADAMAQSTDAAGSPNGGIMQIVMLVGLFLFMYFIIIRPQRKRQKEHQSLVDALSKGDEVVMTSGMLGKIIEVDEGYVTLNVAQNVDLKFQKVAVHAVLPKGTIKSI